MIRKMLCILLGVALVMTPLHAQNVVLSRQDAVNAVITELGLTDTGQVMVWSPYEDNGFGHKGVLPAGTTIRPKITSGTSGGVTTLTGPSYFFFVDDNMVQDFWHPVRYVFVAATSSQPALANGTISVVNHQWWPMIQKPGEGEVEFVGGDGYSMAPSDVFNPDGLVFGPNNYYEEVPPVEFVFDFDVDQKRASAKSCAILATGDPSDRDFQGDAKGFKKGLKARGVPDSRIKEIPNATKQNLKDAIKAACQANPACDKIYIYLGGHGNDGGIDLGEWITKKELCEILEPLGKKSIPVCIWIQSCGSGALATDALKKKLPNGVIITSTGPGKCSLGGYVTGKGWYSLLVCAFLECWDDKDADYDGDGKVSWGEAFKWVCEKNPKVKVGTTEYDVKDPGPTITGIPDKVKRYGGPDTWWFTEIKRDTDHDGKYDQCDWAVDEDCDGNADRIYLEDDKDEDGNPESTRCYSDDGDNGTWDRRYTFHNPNDDGKTDNITCETLVDGNWVATAQAPNRSYNSFFAMDTVGPFLGNQPVMLHSNDYSWENPEISVFIGSGAQKVDLLDPYQIMAFTSGYAPGTKNIIVADFNPDSPSYGFDELENGYTYQAGLSVDDVSPGFGSCLEMTTITVTGTGFTPEAMVLMNGELLPTAMTEEGGLTAEVPPGMNCGENVDVTVAYPPYDATAHQATLEGAFFYKTLEDTNPPVIYCPESMMLFADESGMAYLPPEFKAVASDEGEVTVYRNQAGGLQPGVHVITFEAIDEAGNSASCDVMVTVEGEYFYKPQLRRGKRN